MNSQQIQTLKKIIENRESKYNFTDYIKNYLDADKLKKIETIEELEDYLLEINEGNQITDTEIVYFKNAIKFLQENDPGLQDSIEIAKEYGYTIDDLNSEILASLLASRKNEENYSTFINEVIYDMEKYF